MTSVKAHFLALSFFLPLALGSAVSSAPDSPAPYAHAQVVEAVTPTPTIDTAPLASPEARADGCPDVVVETFGERADEACAVSYCESKWDSGAVGDNGRSLGFFQLWEGWAKWSGVEPYQLFDLTTNTKVAYAILQHRGRWGGSGGWSCADHLGIY